MRELDLWAREQHKKGVRDPDYGDFMERYLKTLSGGNTTSHRFWSLKTFDSVTGWMRGGDSIMDEVAP